MCWKCHIVRLFVTQEKREKTAGVEGPPREEGPIRAVPKARDEEDDEGVANALEGGATAAAKGDVEVVAEPGGQRDVPPAPELRDVAREVRVAEVGHQADAEELGATDGDV